MSRKTLAHTSALILVLLLAFLAFPGSARAGGLCGGLYTVDPGDTIEKIASRCGMSVADIYTANPGLSATLYSGEVLNLAVGNPVPFNPNNNYSNPTPVPIPSYNNNFVPATNNGFYIVQYGDTFSGIASRFGISMYTLWSANPYITNVNILYAGQALYIPGYRNNTSGNGQTVYPQTPEHLSYGTIPPGAPRGQVHLSNLSNGDVYVSLQGTTRDGAEVINEYTVVGNMSVNIPAGWYTYVAWVGGKKFVGQFNLGGDTNHTIRFYSNRVTVN